MKFLQSLYECLKKVKLPGNGYENEIKVNVMLESQLQCKDYWMKKHRFVYAYGLNERTKFLNIAVTSVENYLKPLRKEN